MEKNQIKVLMACVEESGMEGAIVTESGLDLETVKKELAELEKQGLVYVDKDQFWASTVEGNNVYDGVRRDGMEKQQSKVLIACVEEHGIEGAIVTESGLDLENVKKELAELEKQGLINKEKEEEIDEKKGFFWSITIKGNNIYYRVK